MSVTKVFLWFVTATPMVPRKPAGDTGETFLCVYRLSTLTMGFASQGGFNHVNPTAGCPCVAGAALGHLYLPIRRLALVYICALPCRARVNAILIFLSMLKVSGSGAFMAKAEFCTVCSIIMEKAQITAQLHKGFCFWLNGTC